MLEPGDELILLTERLGLLADLEVGRVEVVGESRVAWSDSVPRVANHRARGLGSS